MMVEPRNGPPERESRPAGNQAASLTAADTGHSNVSRAVRQWRRGRAELPCGHYGDPHRPCWRCEPITDRQAEAAADAIEHLDAHGLPGLADSRTCRGLWRIGRRDLATAVHRRTTGEGV